MYEEITDVNPGKLAREIDGVKYYNPMMIFPAIHYTMGGIWVDYELQTTVPGLYMAGDVTGVEEASSAMEEGNLAGVSAAESLGLLTAEEAAAKKAEIWGRLNVLRSGPFGEKRRMFKESQLQYMRDYQAQKGGAQ